MDPSNPTPPDLATTLTEHDRLQSRRVREIAARWKTRIHSDAFAGMVRLAAQDEWALLGPDVHIQHLRGISLRGGPDPGRDGHPRHPCRKLRPGERDGARCRS